MTIAEQVILALAGDFVPFAVNVAATEVSETVRPFLPPGRAARPVLRLPERRAARAGSRSSTRAAWPATNTSILTLAVLKGVFAAGTEEPVSYVNAPQLADERGLEVREVSTATARDYVNLITLRSPDALDRRHAAGAALRAADRAASTTTPSRCPRPSTCWWCATTTVPG